MAPVGSGRWKFVLVILVLVGGLLELLAFGAGKILAKQSFLYSPPSFAGYADYLARRDPVLGWPDPHSFGVNELDASGSRRVPAFPDPAAPSCVALFGDSFTFGDEVGPEDAYGNVLATNLGCRVANFGVGGYGTDQAVLRYEAIKPGAPVVVLGHMSENIIRNINQERGFLTNTRFGLKPRFVLRDGHLQVLPLPALDEATYRDLPDHADALLPLDYFRPGGPGGLVNLRFPFSLSVARAFGHYRLRAGLRHEPSYAQFYRPEHPSGALDLTVAIVERFVADARARAQAPLVLLIPDVKDLETLAAGHPLAYQPLVERLTRDQVPFVSAAEPLMQVLHGRQPCALYFRCSGSHFRPEGYRALAEIVERELRQRGLVHGAAAGGPAVPPPAAAPPRN
jgi:hypothetical protein